MRERDARGEVARLVAERHTAQADCPHCASPAFVRFGTSGGTQRYRCKACHKTFTALTGTPVARLRGKEQLLANGECMAEGLSVRKTAVRLNMSIRKAFRWRHKFLALLSPQRPSGMTGVVEADETFFDLSFKGQRKGLPRAPKKRGGRASYGVVAKDLGIKAGYFVGSYHGPSGNGTWHVQNVNAYHQRLKFHSVAIRYLPHYLA